MPALAEFQAQLAAALHEPEAPLRERLGVGLSVYQNTVAKGLVDALRANYPTIERLVGTQWFDAVSRDFAMQYLPPQPSLALYGEQFADYLLELSEGNALPYLPFVARLDRLWLEAHFAVDAPRLSALQLQSLGESLTNTCVHLHPAARLARLPQSALTIWRSNRPPVESPATLDVSGDAEYVLLTRPHGEVLVNELNAAEYTFIAQIDSGATLGEAALYVLQCHAEVDVAAMLAKFIGAGTFAALFA